jgi:DNA gyrase subunit B
MLASAEVGTLITALGCGIGKDEYNPDKLRYHRIIIMTDADVDGSHIRTLLLTFFYRQMPELIERGHIYIGLPPLYKIKQGKNEQYIKDDQSLNAYLINHAVDGAALHYAPETPPVSGPALESLMTDFSAAGDAVRRLGHRFDARVLEALIDLPPLTPAHFRDIEALAPWLERLELKLRAAGLGAPRYRVHAQAADEQQPGGLVVERQHHGLTSTQTLPATLFGASEWRPIGEAASRIADLIQTEARIERGGRSQTVSRFEQVHSWLLEEAKRGRTIQRFKGLGEMNPEQLWETTVNPETRRLLKVRVEDAVAADEIFSTLMGDVVEPRREFIESNALKVANLDV